MSSTPAAAERRSYRSARREDQARETRERILTAAVTEFARVGYAATPLRVIAEKAGVSVPMVELAFGTKPRLLQAAISFSIRGDAEPAAMLERPWASAAMRATSVSDFLAIVTRVLVEGEQRSAGLMVAEFEAANQDTSMSALADRLRRNRAETATWLVDGLVARDPLRSEITREQAIDTVWLLMDPHGFQALTRDRGWAPERFGEWFIDSVCRLLLADGPGRSPGPEPTRPARRSRTSTSTERRRP